MKKTLLLISGLLLFAACQNPSGESRALGQNQVNDTVYATVETTPVQWTQGDDAADDPALWYHRQNPEQSLVLGTNKRLGLEVYNLKGQRVKSFPTGRVNNVDLRYDFILGQDTVDVAGASNRDFNRIDLWSISRDSGQFRFVSDTNHRSNLQEVYGFCLYRSPLNGRTYAFVNDKTGGIEQWLLVNQDSLIALEKVRELRANKQVEGMVADDETALLYVGEEEGGIFVYPAEPEDDTPRRRIAQSGAENPNLAYDIEGLSLYYSPNKQGYLLASSQGNNRFALFNRADSNRYLGTFTVGDQTIDGAEETDGVALCQLALGGNFPQGIFICQDGFNRDGGIDVAQNFKLVPWEQIARCFEPPLNINPDYRQMSFPRGTN